ncbi:MAG: DUF2867 domain-containing protein [Acidimicrobiales bacterium]
MPTDPDWAGGTLLCDSQTARTDAAPEALFRAVQGIGGDRGWFVTPLLWKVRGWADKLVGGVGMRRGRRHPDTMWVGGSVDFWRVEAVEPPSLIRLRAEMRLPGEAWLEWRIEPDEPRPGTRGSALTQRAIFYPRGLLGRLYWYCLIPFHALIFKQMAERIAGRRADVKERVGGDPGDPGSEAAEKVGTNPAPGAPRVSSADG